MANSAPLANVLLGGVVRVKALHHLSGAALVSRLKEHVDIDSELDGVTSWPRSEVVLAGLQARLPGVEVHRRHFGELRVLLVEVKTLGLADVRASGDGEVHHSLLLDLPNGLVDFTQMLRDLRDVLHAAIVGNDLVLDSSCPQAELKEISDEVLVHDNELSG